MSKNMKQVKVALVLAGNIENAPYLSYYTDMLTEKHIGYDIISWDRLSFGTKGTYCFSLPSDDFQPFYKKMIDYVKYSGFIKKTILNNAYDVVIVFTVANIIFLGSFLLKHQKPFIIDIRDYSPLIPFFRKRIRKTLEGARLNVISSTGFKKFLPTGIEYEISHNVQHHYLLSQHEAFVLPENKPLCITSFGLIRDYLVYQKLLTELKNSPKYNCAIAGPGIEPLQEFATKNAVHNVKFSGRYNKEQESSMLIDSDFIFILLPRSVAHDYAMANRFYQALVKRRPMIVNEGSIHADYVKAYHLGIVMSLNENIATRLNHYIDSFDHIKFNDGCNKLIFEIEKDIQQFEKALTYAVCS